MKTLISILVLTFISCNLIAEEKTIQEIDKETFCKEIIQTKEKNECYLIKNYIDKFLRDEWFEIYTSDGYKNGYSFASESIKTLNGKHYYVFKSKDIYIGDIDGESAEQTEYQEETFQAFYPFKLVKSEVGLFDSTGNDYKLIGEQIGSDLIIIKIPDEGESKKTIKEFNFDLLTNLSFSLIFEKELQVGDEYNLPTYNLVSLYKDSNSSSHTQFKIHAVEDKTVDGKSTKVFTIDAFLIDQNGSKESTWQFDIDEQLYIHEIRPSKDVYDGVYKAAPEEIARQIHYGDNIYLGEHQAGLPHGMGKMNYSSGDQYEGEWFEGLRHGKGKSTHIDGDIYIGNWANGERNGYGKYFFPSGNIYDGEWKNDKRHGFGISYYSDGTKEEGQWENGELKEAGS